MPHSPSSGSWTSVEGLLKDWFKTAVWRSGSAFVREEIPTIYDNYWSNKVSVSTRNSAIANFDVNLISGISH
jgi:hypothetical protein